MPVNRGNEARVYGEKSSHCISQLSLGNPIDPYFSGVDSPIGREPFPLENTIAMNATRIVLFVFVAIALFIAVLERIS